MIKHSCATSSRHDAGDHWQSHLWVYNSRVDARSLDCKETLRGSDWRRDEGENAIDQGDRKVSVHGVDDRGET